MADSKKQKGNVGGTIGMVIGLIGAAAPIVTAALEKMPVKTEPQKEIEPLVTVPDICEKGFPLTLEQATEKLSSEGFKVIASEMVLNDAKPKYRTCIDTQVVDSRPKSKSKVKPGTTVVVRYISQDVINESRRLFDEAEQNKVEVRAQKTADRQKQIEQTKQVAADVIGRTKSSIGRIFTRSGRKEKDHEQE